MSTEELEAYVNSQFDELRRLVRLEERRTLHLVDLKEAFLTASAAEKIAEISVETERLQEEMANITHQLCILEQAEEHGLAPALAAQALLAGQRPAHRAQVRPALSSNYPYPLPLKCSLAARLVAGRKLRGLIRSNKPSVTHIQDVVIYSV